MTHDCIFCRIAGGSIPSHRVYESDRVLAIMDIRPIRPGHVLVLPVHHHPYFDDMPADVAAEVMAVAQRLAPGMRRLFGVERVAMFFTGVDVAHAHAHVVPMHELTDVTSGRYMAGGPLALQLPPAAAPQELADVAQQIRAALQVQLAP